MKRKFRVMAPLCGLVFWMALAVAPVAATDAEGPVANESYPAEFRDPEALAELKKATDFLVAQPRFSFSARIFYDVIQTDGRRLQFEKTGEITLQRPNQLYVESRHDDGVWRKLWYQGEELSIADLSKNLHTQVKAPPSVDETLDMLEDLVREPQPLADLLYSDLSHLQDHAIEADIVGDSLLDGLSCVHLAFRGETIDWQIWVELSATPFIRKVALSYREAPGNPQYVALINDWTTPEQFSDEIFQFKVPQGSQWIKVLTSRTGPARKGDQP
ncbi:MAG: DUF2092 domain-containing protein [Desulfuromonadales bacterium]